MSNIEAIDSYNDGSVYPNNYDLTYLATKHIQKENLIINDDVVAKLKHEINNSGLFFDDDDIASQLVTSLIKGNIIIQGPPGTGKTSLIPAISRAFNVDCQYITAVSDWTTYDTIGGLQPSVDNEGNEIITGKNGRVIESIVKCCETVLNNIAYSGEKQATWLVIDELNRTEIDKVFGDLFTVFGSDNIENKKIDLWFEDDENKKTLYIPNRFRIIGLMNNADKSYVFDFSHALARRFSMISVYPPAPASFEREIIQVKNNVKTNLPNKIGVYNGTEITENIIDSFFSNNNFVIYENILKRFLKCVRYDENDYSLNAQFGTAQIYDIYENIVLRLIIEGEINSPNNELLERVIDSTLCEVIIPQIDGLDYLKINEFLSHVINTGDYDFLKMSKKGIEALVK